ncbi:RidA family protein [Variovorax dokdonensis]|uniref:RidA family protein n=1 Tax=Variovorax dokdonensis TaxID=344883 RepID=A0ABT7NAF8_9BURK|nr:RidA family protein [Variovorax dokdonensis]MDM0044923.1 RidA family protein [Variovorax dokdonensis]
MSNADIERIPSPLPVPFSKAVRAGGFVFLSGVLAMDAQANIIEGGIQAQTKAVLERIALTLSECGLGMSDVVRATIWLADLNEFGAFNEEYSKHFAGALPARSTVEAKLYKGARVEIEVQALDRR